MCRTRILIQEKRVERIGHVEGIYTAALSRNVGGVAGQDEAVQLMNIVDTHQVDVGWITHIEDLESPGIGGLIIGIINDEGMVSGNCYVSIIGLEVTLGTTV